MRLRELSAEAYAREVLPQTAELWAGRRNFDAYVDQTLALATSAYGRRFYRTIGLYDGGTLVASFKRYERAVQDRAQKLRAFGFGAVFTPPEYRGRGYASILLASALDAARAEGYDVAFLFSDIRPQFYAELGFRALPSREFSLRADALPSGRLAPTRLDSDEDWRAVRRCYEFGLRRGEHRLRPQRDALGLDASAHRARLRTSHRRHDESRRAPRQGRQRLHSRRARGAARHLRRGRVRLRQRSGSGNDSRAAARRGWRSAAYRGMASAGRCARSAYRGFPYAGAMEPY